jgi:hypothetical protein
MYSLALIVHSWWRWVVLALLLAATIRAIGGRSSGRAWSEADRRANMLAVVSIDVQMLLGLVLYLFLSPFTRDALNDFGAAMRTPNLRYWAVEHVSIMAAALVAAHVGNVLVRRATTDLARYRRGAIFFGLALLLTIIGIPWPGMSNGRELFRLSASTIAQAYAFLF